MLQPERCLRQLRFKPVPGAEQQETEPYAARQSDVSICHAKLLAADSGWSPAAVMLPDLPHTSPKLPPCQ